MVKNSSVHGAKIAPKLEEDNSFKGTQEPLSQNVDEALPEAGGDDSGQVLFFRRPCVVALYSPAVGDRVSFQRRTSPISDKLEACYAIRCCQVPGAGSILG